MDGCDGGDTPGGGDGPAAVGPGGPRGAGFLRLGRRSVRRGVTSRAGRGVVLRVGYLAGGRNVFRRPVVLVLIRELLILHRIFDTI